MSLLQQQFDELELAGVFAKTEDLGVSVDPLKESVFTHAVPWACQGQKLVWRN